VLLLLGVIGLGILVPLFIQRKRAVLDFVLPAALVLVGGFLLRMTVLLSSEQVRVVGAQVLR
jgi:formate-dependent nitrite reductase membrane component NrfD